MFSVGSTVRVLDPLGQIARLAMISGMENSTYDIIYEGDNGEEEEKVAPDRISMPLPFEEAGLTVILSSMEGKECGNALFAKRDYQAARRYYLHALKLIEKPQLTVGTLVILAPDTHPSSSLPSSVKRFRCGMVSDISDSGVEVVFDEEDEDDQGTEEGGGELLITDTKRLLPLQGSIEGRTLERSLYGNLAKCCIQLKIHGYACRYVSIAIEVQKSCKDGTEHDQYKKCLADMLFVRAKVFIAVSKPKLASQDVKSLVNLDPIRAATLQKELDMLKARRVAQNKKLARDVAVWVDTAMRISEEKKLGSQASTVVEDRDDGDCDFGAEDRQGIAGETSSACCSGGDTSNRSSSSWWSG